MGKTATGFPGPFVSQRVGPLPCSGNPWNIPASKSGGIRKYFSVRSVKFKAGGWKALGNIRVKEGPLMCREAAPIGGKAGQRDIK